MDLTEVGKRYGFTIAGGIIGALLVAILGGISQEMASSLTGVLIQTGKCVEGDSICILFAYLIIVLLLVWLGLVIDSVRNGQIKGRTIWFAFGLILIFLLARWTFSRTDDNGHIDTGTDTPLPATSSPTETATLTPSLTASPTPTPTMPPTVSPTPEYQSYIKFVDAFYQAIDTKDFATAWAMETAEFQNASTEGRGFEWFEEFWQTFRPGYQLAHCEGSAPNEIAVHLIHYYKWDTALRNPRPVQYWFEYTITEVYGTRLIFKTTELDEGHFDNCFPILSFPEGHFD